MKKIEKFFKNMGVAVLSCFRALECAWKFFFCKSIEIYKTNKYVKKYQHVFQKCGRDSFLRFVGVRVVICAACLSIE